MKEYTSERQFFCQNVIFRQLDIRNAEKFIEKIKHRENLSFDESRDAFKIIMDGDAEDRDIFDLLHT